MDSETIDLQAMCDAYANQIGNVLPVDHVVTVMIRPSDYSKCVIASNDHMAMTLVRHLHAWIDGYCVRGRRPN